MVEKEIKEWPDDCPLYQLFDTLWKKRSLHIIVCIYKGIHSFSGIMKSLPKINTRILTERLDELIQQDYIEKKALSKRSSKAEYYLWEKWKDLIKNLQSLKQRIVSNYTKNDNKQQKSKHSHKA